MSSHVRSKLLGTIIQRCTASRMFDTSCVKNKKGTFHKDVVPKAFSTKNNTTLLDEGIGSLSLLTKLTLAVPATKFQFIK
jgi:hypothetical protein